MRAPGDAACSRTSSRSGACWRSAPAREATSSCRCTPSGSTRRRRRSPRRRPKGWRRPPRRRTSSRATRRTRARAGRPSRGPAPSCGPTRRRCEAPAPGAVRGRRLRAARPALRPLAIGRAPVARQLFSRAIARSRGLACFSASLFSPATPSRRSAAGARQRRERRCGLDREPFSVSLADARVALAPGGDPGRGDFREAGVLARCWGRTPASSQPAPVREVPSCSAKSFVRGFECSRRVAPPPDRPVVERFVRRRILPARN